VGEAKRPELYSIAAHRGFADALVAGLVPRYSDPELGLAQLTLLLPSSRAARSISEAFIRHAGATEQQGLLMPRMVMVGDIDLDEALGSLLDPLGASEIPPAVDPTRRWLEVAKLLRTELESDGRPAPSEAVLLRLSREVCGTMDRMIAEERAPEDLLSEAVIGQMGDVAVHWQDNVRLFARVQARWSAHLAENGQVDLATRRNLLFDHAAKTWRANPPQSPIVAAGVTSAAPALARLLRTIAGLPQGAVILPDLDLSMDDAAWDELGRAGQSPEPGELPFSTSEAATHPQYHLKLLLNRMSVARGEVRQWHRKGLAAAPPERSHAISSLFLPPEASKVWADLPADKRRLSGVRLLTSATSEEEAQAVSVLVREALEVPEKRVAVVTPDRSLARRIVQHLARWNIAADDTAGRPLSLTPAGRLMLQLAELASDGPTPVELVAALAHPLVRRGDTRREWLEALRAFDRQLRGPRPKAGPAALASIARKAGVEDWWGEVEALLGPLFELASHEDSLALSDALATQVELAEALAGEALWAQEDGRSLSRFVDELKLQAAQAGTMVKAKELRLILQDAMEQVAVRPPYGGHPRVAIYGLLEARMTRADLVICAGLNEGTWPQTPSQEALLAPAILRSLGMPTPEFRIGLAAHDLASLLGAPEVVLTRSLRDVDGPAIPSRFLLRIEALLGDRVEEHRETQTPKIAAMLDRQASPQEEYPRPMPMPSAELRDVPIKVTALDRLLGDPYQFYAQEILKLRTLDPLDADPNAAWQGTVAHSILQRWHEALEKDADASIHAIADMVLEEAGVHPLVKGLWQPRLTAALEWVAQEIRAQEDRDVIAVERKGSMTFDGVTVYGRADRIDRLQDGTLAIVDYKTGKPPSAKQVEKGFALQLGILGLIAREGDFGGLSGDASLFEYWSLAKANGGDFGYVDEPLKNGGKRSGLTAEEFLPAHEGFLSEAIAKFIKGDHPFTARLNPDYPAYNDYDQLMRLDEWQTRLAQAGEDSA
jgi:ATP-dependent helicase/nuclease subunit B